MFLLGLSIELRGRTWKTYGATGKKQHVAVRIS